MLALRTGKGLFRALRACPAASECVTAFASYGQERRNSASANTNFFIREVRRMPWAIVCNTSLWTPGDTFAASR